MNQFKRSYYMAISVIVGLVSSILSSIIDIPTIQILLYIVSGICNVSFMGLCLSSIENGLKCNE